MSRDKSYRNSSAHLILVGLICLQFAYLAGMAIGIGAGEYPFAREPGNPRDIPVIACGILLFLLILSRWIPTRYLPSLVILGGLFVVFATVHWQWDQRKWLALPRWATIPAANAVREDPAIPNNNAHSGVDAWPTCEQLSAYQYHDHFTPSKAKVRACVETKFPYEYRYAPASVARETHESEFDVNYHIGFDGWRAIPDYRPTIMLLGCSFTFGVGVKDDENYASHLARRWPAYHISNRSMSGWGTTQAYLALEAALKGGETPVAVMYGYISDHLRRNYIRRSWIEGAKHKDSSFHYFELGNDGNLQIRYNVRSKDVTLLDDTQETTRKEIAVTETLVREMDKMCRERHIPFVFVAIDMNMPIVDDPIVDFVKRSSIPFIDTRGLCRDAYPIDGHPRPLWHDVVARRIAGDPLFASFSPLPSRSTNESASTP